MTPQDKAWIDSATLYELLYRWRYAHPGSHWFTGEVGEYYSARMGKLRAEDPAAWTRVSKEMGWG